MALSSIKRGSDDGEENNFIDYTEPPSLQHIALVSVAVRLWTEPDMLEDIKNLVLEDPWLRELDFEPLEKRVLKKLNENALPDLLKSRVSNFIKRIRLQLSDFDYYENFKDSCDFQDICKMGGSIYYTMEGITDKTKSLRELIHNENPAKDFGSLYVLACKYCLEENISYLWRNISSERKKAFHKTYNNTYEYHIVDYWTASLENELPNLLERIKFFDDNNIYDSNYGIYRNMTCSSIFAGNIYALKYFWRKLTEQEKNNDIENWIDLILKKIEGIVTDAFETHIKMGAYGKLTGELESCTLEANILFFLLSKLNDQSKQKRVFENHSRVILRLLFDCWPWQRFFLPTIQVMFDYLPERVYVEIMDCITEEVVESTGAGELFREVWCLSPFKLKTSYLPYIKGTLWNLYEANDVRTIDRIISNASVKERQDMYSNIIANNYFKDVILSGKFPFLDALISKLLPPDCNIEYFKKHLVLCHSRVMSRLIIGNDFQIVDSWLKWGSTSENEIPDFKKELINPLKIYIPLIRLNDFERVDNFLKWYFATEEEVVSFVKAFFHEDNFPRCFNLLIKMSEDHELGWDNFEKFINYSLSSTEETSRFKILYLKSVSTIVKVRSLDFATKFLNWCLDSPEKVNQFKNDLLLSKKGIGMLLNSLNDTSWDWLLRQRTLAWFFPLSSETLEKLKSLKESKFIGRDSHAAKNKKRAFIYLLECFASKYITSYNADDFKIIDLRRILKGKDADCNRDSSDSEDSDDIYYEYFAY